MVVQLIVLPLLAGSHAKVPKVPHSYPGAGDSKDNFGNTPKERAQGEKRNDVMEVFDEFERRADANCISQNSPIEVRTVGGGLFLPLRLSS